jgi:hypothetical protein
VPSGAEKLPDHFGVEHGPAARHAADGLDEVRLKAASITPATKSAAVPSTAGRRAILSAILPVASAPMRAPISRMLVSSSLSNDVRPGKSLPMNSNAPEMTPVS